MHIIRYLVGRQSFKRDLRNAAFSLNFLFSLNAAFSLNFRFFPNAAFGLNFRFFPNAALSGGVFQNGLLLKLVVNPLREAGFEVLLHSMVPPNDGGIALGQALAALAAFEKKA